MPNRQLTEYIRAQMAQGVPLDQLRLLLVQQGWAPQDVSLAVDEVVGTSHKTNKKKHHTNYVAISVLGIVVLMMIGGLFLMVFGKDADDPITQNPITLPEESVPPIVTGWAICEQSTDGYEKDACYQDIHRKENFFDCDTISDSIERSFCFRARETVLIDQYNAQL